MRKKYAVIAIGGNSLITDKNHQTVQDQYQNVYKTCLKAIKLIEKGYNIILTHGNGPQVGFSLRRSELAAHELHPLPLDTCVANTQGSIGYQAQKAFYNAFLEKKVKVHKAVTLITQTVVDINDPAFKNPSKPIGSFMDEEKAKKHAKEKGWTIKEDAGRGWRRVVPSPKPVEIFEMDIIKSLIEQDYLLIAGGGGGIPIYKEKDGTIHGIEAVVDKDLASSLIAINLKADVFIISTAVDQVYLDFGKPNAKPIAKMTVTEAEHYMLQGHFASGSMLPKIRAAADYVKATGGKALITSPEKMLEAFGKKTGTFIIP